MIFLWWIRVAVALEILYRSSIYTQNSDFFSMKGLVSLIFTVIALFIMPLKAPKDV